MQFGRSYEEFEVGAVYKHWPGKTVTEYDDHLFCLITMNHHPLHLDVNYAEKTTQFGKNVVVGNYIYSLLLGMSVPDVSRQGDRQPRGRVAAARGADVPRRHDLRRDHGARQDGVQVQGRPRRRLRRDQGLQPGRHGRVHLPPQGHGAQAELPTSPRWRTAGPADNDVRQAAGSRPDARCTPVSGPTRRPRAPRSCRRTAHATCGLLAERAASPVAEGSPGDAELTRRVARTPRRGRAQEPGTLRPMNSRRRRRDRPTSSGGTGPPAARVLRWTLIKRRGSHRASRSTVPSEKRRVAPERSSSSTWAWLRGRSQRVDGAGDRPATPCGGDSTRTKPGSAHAARSRIPRPVDPSPLPCQGRRGYPARHARAPRSSHGTRRTCPRCGDAAIAQAEAMGLSRTGDLAPLVPGDPRYETFAEHLGAVPRSADLAALAAGRGGSHRRFRDGVGDGAGRAAHSPPARCRAPRTASWRSRSSPRSPGSGSAPGAGLGRLRTRSPT